VVKWAGVILALRDKAGLKPGQKVLVNRDR